MFLIYGQDRFLIQKQVNKIINIMNEEEQDNIFKFDVLNDDFKEILQLIFSPPLFNKKQFIVIENCLFLTNDKKYDLTKFQEKKIIEFCENKPAETEIFFIVYENTLSKTKKIVKVLQKYGKLLLVKSLENQQLQLFIKNYFKKNQIIINDETLENLLIKLPNNLQIIVNELNKLINHSSNIDNNIINKLVSDYSESNIFSLVNAFFNQDFNKVWKYYYEFKNSNQDILPLIAMIANQLRTIRDIKVYQRQSKSFDSISQKLSLNPYRLKILWKYLSKIEDKQINYLLETLSNLDYNIKRNLIDKNIGFEIFLLQV